MTTTIPTDAELKQHIIEARETLRLTRVDVANGTADAARLADAEQALRFAETRLGAVEEARYERRRQQDRVRAAEIVEELESLKPAITQQREREEAIRALVTEYLDAAIELRSEIAGAYSELLSMREHSKATLAEYGIRVTAASTVVRLAGTTYGAPDGLMFLRELEREAGNKGGRLSPRAKPAPRPARKRKAA